MGKLLIFKKYQLLKNSSWIIDGIYGGKDKFVITMEELREHLENGGNYNDFLMNPFEEDVATSYKQKKWEDYSASEKIKMIIENQWYIQDYTEYATQQRYLKQFDSSIIVDPYIVWVKKLVENGKV